MLFNRRSADRPASRRSVAAVRRTRYAALALAVAFLLGSAAVVVAPADGPSPAPTAAETPPTVPALAVADLSSVRATELPQPARELELLPALAEDGVPMPLVVDSGIAFGASDELKTAKKVAKLQQKITKAQGKVDFAQIGLDAWVLIAAQSEVDVDDAEVVLSQAYQQLAAALVMPDDTLAQQQLKADAIAAANKAIKAAKKGLKQAEKARKKAYKTIAKLSKVIEKNEKKIVGLTAKLEELAPGSSADVGTPTLTGVDGVGQVTFTWPKVSDADSYNFYWSVSPGVPLTSSNKLSNVSSPFSPSGVAPGSTLYAVVTAVNQTGEGQASNEVGATNLQGGTSAASVYWPDWADVQASNVITLDHDPALSDTDNGAILRSAVLALQPGDRLEIGGGTWSIVSKFSPSASGTANAPIWIVAQDGETPVITRPDANQNVMNPSGSYMCFRGLEITGGSAGIKIDQADNIWIDQCHIHHIGEAGIAANSADTSKLYITGNHIHHTAGYGEGMYLGANNGAVIMSESVIAQNLVHDTTGPNVLQGDGIEIKQGSWGNWIAENTIYNTNYPCLIAYGTGGQPVNLIERNTLIGSGDNVMQVQGEAIVRSNLMVNGATGFQSNDHQGQTRDLTFVHNTVVNSGQAVRLVDWDNRPGMVFANNAIYTQSSTAVQFSSGSTGVTITGNVVNGGVTGASGAGFTMGVGLSDFEDASWTGTVQDVTPAQDSALLGAGDPAWAVPEDLAGDGFGGGAPAAGAVAAP